MISKTEKARRNNAQGHESSAFNGTVRGGLILKKGGRAREFSLLFFYMEKYAS